MEEKTMGSLGSSESAPGSPEKWRLAARLFEAESSPPDPPSHAMLALQTKIHLIYPVIVAKKTELVLE